MCFSKMITNAWTNNKSMVCVGLDPDPAKIPHFFSDSSESIFEFNKAIIDATSDLVCAYKLQIAYYSAYGLEDQLLKSIEYIHEHAKWVPAILDSKRGDIGSTAQMYAKEAFVRYNADAVTANPFLGLDSLKPFLDHEDKGVFVLCRTSNPGGSQLQDFPSPDNPLYLHIARTAEKSWNYNNNVGLVAGATYPEELQQIRSLVPTMPLLIPGIGFQGGDLESSVTAGIDEDGMGIIINSSRGIIYAGKDADFAEKSRAATLDLRDKINAVIEARQ